MAVSPTSSLLRPWSDLPPELLGRTIARLPFPADRAHFRAVYRGWRAAARSHLRQLPWLVLSDGSFCTLGDGISDDDGGGFFPLGTISGVPEDTNCVGSTGGWLVLDRTSDAFWRTKLVDKLRSGAYDDYPHRGVTHGHSYLLHNPFSGKTVPLPELDAIIGHASERFMVRKVLMRSSSPDDVIAVVTNSLRCNVILCRPGKGTHILGYFRVCAIEFVGDRLYGITPDEDLLAFRIVEDGDGKPIVTDRKRIIKHQFSDGEKDLWAWMDWEDDNDNNNNGDSDDDDDPDDDEAPMQEVKDIFHEYVMVSDDEEIGPYTEAPHKGHAVTIRNLVKSQGGELLMVRRLVQEPPFTYSYTRELEIFKADVDAGTWISITHDALDQDEALFLSRGFCKSSPLFGDMEDGFIYFDNIEEVFDTREWTSMPFYMPWQRGKLTTKQLTWLFPPELVV